MNPVLAAALAILILPIAAFTPLALMHKRIPALRDKIATGIMGITLALSLYIFGVSAFGEEPVFIHWTFDWLPVSSTHVIQGGILVDGLTAIMLVVVTLVSFLVHLFSISYMKDDVRYGRYFCGLLLFSFSMLGLVLADNILFLFVFWELVGLSSYILIGHWYEKKSASNAAIKAFITTRIGDVGMLIGILIIYWKVGSFAYVDIFAAVSEGILSDGEVAWQTLAGLGLFLGAMGKSAQWPFHVWLPDAMEGPTPVSALIHAATMVAAGVYLVGRLYPIFTPDAFLFIAYIGAITALFAATIATVQDDIKKVLAYSTLSQLGYMMLALGVGGYVSGLFHLTTHAFFKAGLFLGSGSIIYAMHHEQSMSKYGGLAKKLPWTHATYLACVLSIAGIPFLSGFMSKDKILADALYFSAHNPTHWFLAFSGFFTAVLTAYYMFRQYFLTFTGKPRGGEKYDHAHESPWQMLLPLCILGTLAICAGWINFERLLPPGDGPAVVARYAAYHESTGTMTAMANVEAMGFDLHAGDHAAHEGDDEGGHAGEHAPGMTHHEAHNIAMAISIIALAIGFGIAFAAFKESASGRTMIDPRLWARRLRPLHTLLWNKYYFDELYGVVFIKSTLILIKVMAAFDKYVIDGIVNFVGFFTKVIAFFTGVILDNWIVDGTVNGVAQLSSAAGGRLGALQTGRVRNYLLYIVVGLVALSVILIAWVGAGV